MAAGGRAFSAVALVSLMVLASFSGCLEEVFGEGGIEGVLGLNTADGLNHANSSAQVENTASQTKASSNTNAKDTGKASAEQPKEPETLVYKPGSYSISALDFQGKTRIILSEADYKSLPVLAPVFKNHGIDASIAWNNGDGVEIAAEDASKFSSQVAVTFWEGKAQKAVVVDSYENALLAGPLAAMLDAPILYYGSTTNEALWRIGANDSSEVISMGNTPYSSKVQASLQNQNAVWEYTISTAKGRGANLNYIAVVNPNDDTDDKFYTAHLSAFGSVLATYRNGLVISTDGDSQKTNALIKSLVNKTVNANMDPKFVCILGDYAAVQPGGWITDSSWEGDGVTSEDENPCPSDNPYVDFDEDNSTVELANGRIIAKTINDMSYYFDRIVNYNSYISNPKKDASPNPLLFGADWNNNAMTYFATRTEYMTLGAETATNNLFRDSSFNTQDDSVQAHCDVENVLGITGMLLPPDFAKSNFIAMMSDHGYPGGCSVSAGDLIDMPPNVFFAASCSLGRIDIENYEWGGEKFTKDMLFTSTVLEKGTLVYFGATRTTWGQWAELPDNPVYGYETQGVGGSQGLGLFVYRYIINENLTTGEALAKAKADFIKEDGNIVLGGNGNANLISWEYHLYGDPAFNPYEPCNEGSK
jgi:hypothetical protein